MGLIGGLAESSETKKDESLKYHILMHILTLIFFCKNYKIATKQWTTIDREMLDPIKKRCLRAKEKPQQDGKRGEIVFRIKPHTCQRWLEGSNKTLCAPGPRYHTKDWARPTLECLSVFCSGMGQQWLAAGTETLASADQGGMACDVSPLGGGCH